MNVCRDAGSLILVIKLRRTLSIMLNLCDVSEDSFAVVFMYRNGKDPVQLYPLDRCPVTEPS
jgi:hypothetical protein